jgi:cell division protein FtsL
VRSAAARTRAGHARVAPPRAPRRVSGPSRRAIPAPGPVRAPGARARTAPVPGLAGGLRALPDHPLLARLLGGRAWIWLIGAALMGIVVMQVSLLKLNTGISRAVQATTTLERSNAQLESEIARLRSNERISRIAAERGMIAPAAGSVVYVRARPALDAPRAVRRMSPPSDAARQVAAVPPAAGAAPAAPGALAADPAADPATTLPTEPPPAPAPGVVAAPTPGQG